MGTNLASFPGNFPKWINGRIGAEVLERREALGLTAYALGRAAGVSDQTILNIEQAVNLKGSWTGTLARICGGFGKGLSEPVGGATGGRVPRCRPDAELGPDQWGGYRGCHRHGRHYSRICPIMAI